VGVTVEMMIVVMVVDVEAEDDDEDVTEEDGGSVVVDDDLADVLLDDVEELLLPASAPESGAINRPSNSEPVSKGAPMQPEQRKRRGHGFMMPSLLQTRR
jgi:hypothetical protein